MHAAGVATHNTVSPSAKEIAEVIYANGYSHADANYIADKIVLALLVPTSKEND